MKYLSLLLISSVLMACGGDDGGDNPDKGLFSLWNQVGNDVPLDLTGGSFNTAYEFFIFESDGSQCDCALRFLGTEESGTYILNNCAYDVGSSQSGDPGCEGYNHSGTYSKTTTTLTICDNEQDCTSYK